MIYAQINPNPIPNFPSSSGPTINLTPSGEVTNPSSWADFVVKVGLPTFLLILVIVIAGLLLWQLLKERKQPDNRSQMDMMRRMMCGSQRSHAAIHRSIRQLAEICRVCSDGNQFSPEQARAIRERVDKINDILATPGATTEHEDADCEEQDDAPRS